MGQGLTKEQVIAIGVPLLLGQIVGAVQGRDSFTWFNILKKPAWCPPSPVFPVVWTALYALMGQASYLVWQHGGFEAQQAAFLLYGIQLLLNLLWPIIFFKLRRIKLAQAENVALLAAALVTTRRFYGVDLRAGRLMIPYIVWLLLANALNFYIAKHNVSADQDSRLQDLYHSDDKRNPGEQGYRPASAVMHTPTFSSSSPRSRGKLQVFARGGRFCGTPKVSRPAGVKPHLAVSAAAAQARWGFTRV